MSTATKVRAIRANNPSALTGPGTTSFLIGEAEVAVIDPGPDDPAHIDAILEAAEGRISHILVTHAHVDHTAGVGRLAALTRAPVFAFGGADAGRSPTMQRLARSGAIAGGEGADLTFQPDVLLRDNEVLQGDGWSLTAVHTPGHMGGHLSFQLGDEIFCGDLVMGWSTSIISPPDGDLVDYFRSLDRLAALGPRRLLPAHGDPVEDPPARFAELAAHRRQRSAQILAALDVAPGTACELAERIYTELPVAMLPAATRNVLAHLIALYDLGAARPDGELSTNAGWKRSV